MICSERYFRNMSVRDITRCVCNEHQLNEVVREAEVMIERLKKKADKTLLRKERIIQLVQNEFLHLQNPNFSPKIMAPVMAALRKSEYDAVHPQGHEYGVMAGMATDCNVSWGEDTNLEVSGASRPKSILLQLPGQKSLNDTGKRHFVRFESENHKDRVKNGISQSSNDTQGHSSTKHYHDPNHNKGTSAKFSNAPGKISTGKNRNSHKFLSGAGDKKLEKNNYSAKIGSRVGKRDRKTYNNTKNHRVSSDSSRNVEKIRSGVFNRKF